MDEKLEDILLIKNFLKMFDVYYEKIPYESMLELKHKGKTDLYQEENKVGTLFYDGKIYKIILSLNGFDLEALSEIKKDKGRRFLTLNYNLVKNSDEIAGKYTINSCNKKNYNQLVSCITNIPDDVISEEDKKHCFEHLDEIVPKK